MANRSYLYSTNFVPGQSGTGHRIAGISESSLRVPLAYKLLLTGNPRRSRSLIWDTTEEIALVADYAQGVDNLIEFLDGLEDPHLRPFIDPTRDFLRNPANKGDYFLLEPMEIFELNDQAPTEQCENLLREIERLDVNEESLRMSSKRHCGLAWLQDLLLPCSSPNIDQKAYDLGLGNWSNVLYHDLSKKQQ